MVYGIYAISMIIHMKETTSELQASPRYLIYAASTSLIVPDDDEQNIYICKKSIILMPNSFQLANSAF